MGGLELLAGGTAFSVVIAILLLNFFFRWVKKLQESDKASRTTIDNHIDHNTEVLSTLIRTNEKAFDNMTEMHEETKDARRDLRETMQENTKASTMQVMTSEQVIKALDRLTERIDK